MHSLMFHFLFSFNCCIFFVLMTNAMNLFGFFDVVFLNLICFQVHKMVWTLEDLKFENNWLSDFLILS